MSTKDICKINVSPFEFLRIAIFDFCDFRVFAFLIFSLSSPGASGSGRRQWSAKKIFHRDARTYCGSSLDRPAHTCLLRDEFRAVDELSSENSRTPVQPNSSPPESLSTPADSTLPAFLESMKRMQRAALYARVSTDAQQKEGTIESQVAELKRQIAAPVMCSSRNTSTTDTAERNSRGLD